MVFLNDLGIICALGVNKIAVSQNLLHADGQEFLSHFDINGEEIQGFYTGRVTQELDNIDDLSNTYISRNNRLLFHAYREIERTFQTLRVDIPDERIAVVLGTSTSGIKEGELARKEFDQTGEFPRDYSYSKQEMAAPSEYLAITANIKGPAYTISTACSSSAKALASAKSLIDADIADIVLCGGVDTLSELPLRGFYSLQSTAKKYCNPFSKERDGINLGESATLFVMSKHESDICLKGFGESSDAYHISAPDPEGAGAKLAIYKAMSAAGLEPEHIDYVNLHGTGTIKNDEIEAQVVSDIFGGKTPVSSTKRFTGHTLGGAGALEAGILWLLLSKQHNPTSDLPINKSDFGIDDSLPMIKLANKNSKELKNLLSNSFAFGGNNIALILGISGE